MSIVSDAIERLPKYCPTWCAQGKQGHLQALEEGCEPESASEHMSVDLCHLLYDLVNPAAQRRDRKGGASWDVRLRADDVDGWMGVPLVALAVQKRVGDTYDRVELNLTTAEARKLAAHLTYLADQEDLHRDDDFIRTGR